MKYDGIKGKVTFLFLYREALECLRRTALCQQPLLERSRSSSVLHHPGFWRLRLIDILTMKATGENFVIRTRLLQTAR